MFGKMFGQNKRGAIFVPLQQHDELRSSSEMDEALLKDVQKIGGRRSSLVKFGTVLAVVACIAAYSALLVVGTAKAVKTDPRLGTRWIKSPVSSYLSYEPREFEQEERYHTTQYFQQPTAEIDENWHELFERRDTPACS
ncbi:hypothetical protein MMC22_010680, partial [Lobaria immixta]|nr:hypothetical protein [Lobaria immixta]